jgi:NAD(P)-dependent dehydrogenase (short-subunit alcohol dehydrogenase family)
MTNRFAGRRIAVTGAAGGIGRAICESLAGQGAQVHGLDLKGLDALPSGVAALETDLSVSALTRSLAVEWGPRGVRINTVSPGYVATPRGALNGEESAFCCGTELLIDGGFSLR